MMDVSVGPFCSIVVGLPLVSVRMAMRVSSLVRGSVFRSILNPDEILAFFTSKSIYLSDFTLFLFFD